MKHAGPLAVVVLIIAIACGVAAFVDSRALAAPDIPSRLLSQDFLIEVQKGNVPGHRIVHKFGACVLDTTLSPCTLSDVYRTPTTATALEVLSADANDTAAGSGAQQLTIIGLNSAWSEVVQTAEMNGVTAVALGTDLIRLTRWYVSRSGTYASQSAGSHAGLLTVREAGGGQTWSTITLVGGLGRGQSQIGAYTVPAGKTAWALSKKITVDTSKTADLFFFKRENADDVTTPFTGAMRLVRQVVGLDQPFGPMPRAPQALCVGPCDVGFLGFVPSTSAAATVDFEILEIDN